MKCKHKWECLNEGDKIYWCSRCGIIKELIYKSKTLSCGCRVGYPAYKYRKPISIKLKGE